MGRLFKSVNTLSHTVNTQEQNTKHFPLVTTEGISCRLSVPENTLWVGNTAYSTMTCCLCNFLTTLWFMRSSLPGDFMISYASKQSVSAWDSAKVLGFSCSPLNNAGQNTHVP